MLSRMRALSFFLIITLSLAANAYDHHHRFTRHHEIALAAARTTAARTQCRPRPTRTPSTSVAALNNRPTSSSSLVDPENRPRPSISSTSSTRTSTSSRLLTSTVAPVPTATSLAHTSAPTTSTAPAAASTETQALSVSASSFTPNNIKAGIAGGDAYPFMVDHIGWWYDWSPTPSKPGPPIAVPMLWGGGTADAQDAARLAAFKKLSTAPRYVLGFEEPDCPSGSGSAGMSVAEGVADWEKYIAPLKAKGTLLGSPSMCKQIDETWLAEFQKNIKTTWDFTAIHINKNNLDGVKKDIEHYAKYGKPIWVTEFACVNDHPNFVPCTDQNEINTFINQVVDYFQGDSRVYAYAYSNGLGLGDVWPLTGKDGKLSPSGKTYLAAISKYH